MRKIKLVIAGLAGIMLMAGCGSRHETSYNDDYGVSMDSATSYSNSMSLGIKSSSKGSMDYHNTYISGDMADYSYNFAADGKVNKKEDVLDEYEKLQAYANEHGGYVENVRNTYTGYDIDWADSYFSENEISYKATGSANFTIQVENDEVENVIKELADFTDANNLTVTRYDQYITNYEAYEIVDEYEDNYRYDAITKEELEKHLKYAAINVNLYYRIPRSGFMRFILSVVNVAKQAKEAFLQILAMLIILAVASLIGLYLIVLPFYKLFKKATYKYWQKHGEYYIPKEVLINDIARRKE